MLADIGTLEVHFHFEEKWQFQFVLSERYVETHWLVLRLGKLDRRFLCPSLFCELTVIVNG